MARCGEVGASGLRKGGWADGGLILSWAVWHSNLQAMQSELAWFTARVPGCCCAVGCVKEQVFACYAKSSCSGRFDGLNCQFCSKKCPFGRLEALFFECKGFEHLLLHLRIDAARLVGVATE